MCAGWEDVGLSTQKAGWAGQADALLEENRMPVFILKDSRQSLTCHD